MRGLPRRRVPICDIALFGDPSRKERFKQIVAHRPVVPADVDVNTHCAILNDFIAQALAACFPLEPKPRKQWVSETTWGIICVRRPWRQMVLAATSRNIDHAKRSCFSAWARRPLPAEYYLDAAGDDRAAAYAQAMLDRSIHDLKRALRHDKAAFVRSLQAECAEAAARNDRRALFELTGTLAGRKPTPPMPTYLEDGTVAKSAAEARDRWRRHFAEVHCGTIATPSELIDQTEPDALPPPELDLDALPTIIELIGAFAKSKRRKAAGIDAIPPDALAALPEEFALVMHPLMLKCAMTMNEPVLWKGGVLATFPKPSGTSKACADFREITLGCAAAKSYHRMMRKRLTPYLNRAAHQSQCGGIDGRSTDSATHYLRTTLYRAQREARTSITIFIDIVAAFYTLVRETVMPLPETQAGWRDYWAATGRDPNELGDLMRLLQQPCAFKTQGVPDHLSRIIAAAHSGTWLTTDNDDLVTFFRLGVLPRDPYGDIVFTFLATTCLDDIRTALTEAGLTPAAPSEPDERPLTGGEQWPTSAPADISYVDDAAFNIDARSAEHATARVKEACAIIAGVFKHYRLKLNFKPGKSEALICLRGPGTMQAKRDLCESGKMKIALDDGGTIHATAAYVHLGGVISAYGDVGPEATRRASAAAGQATKIRGPVITNPLLDIDEKVSLVRSLVHSSLLYNVGTWANIPSRAATRVATAYLKPLRRAAGVRYRDGRPTLSDAQVLVATNMPPLTW